MPILPTTVGIDGYATAPGLVGAAPGGQALVSIGYGSQGAQVMAGATLSVTLDGGLSYVGANPPPQSISGAGSNASTVLNWSLPNLALSGYGRVLLTTGVPSTTIGAQHSVQVAVSAPNEQNGADNSWVTQVMEALQMFLSLIRR